MFDKIKGKLKGIFSKSQDEIFEEDKIEETPTEESPEMPLPPQSLSSGKKDKKENKGKESIEDPEKKKQDIPTPPKPSEKLKDKPKLEKKNKEEPPKPVEPIKETETTKEEITKSAPHPDDFKELGEPTIPIPPKPPEEQPEKEEEAEQTKEEKKPGFFSRLFKKKEKEESEAEPKETQKEIEEPDASSIETEHETNESAENEIQPVSREELDKELDLEEDLEKAKKEEEEVEKEQKEIEKKITKQTLIDEEIIDEPEEKVEEKSAEYSEDLEKLEKPTIPTPPKPQEEEEKIEKEEKKGFFSKTFGKLTSKKLTEEDFEKIWINLEIFLLEINIAYEIVQKIETRLRETIIGESFNRFSLSEKIREILIDEVSSVLKTREADFIKQIKEINKKAEIAKILVLGVNGTGKTTTIAKIVHTLQKENLSVVVAASDTFRAAAVEQLEEHSNRVGFKLIKHSKGSDPAAVAYDAIEHAKAKNLNVALIDTAGRMPNNSNLMQELSKIKRVTASDINLFIGDSISGNDLIDQIELFDKVVGIDGVILTKTDTDERPGSIVTASYSIDKPIYYLGVGQGYDDLVKFDAKHVAEKLFEIDEE